MTEASEKPGDLAVGTVVAERFRVEAKLGAGGYGTVYRATQLSVDRPVALKLLHADLARRDDVAARFEREARLASRVRHPNAVSVIDFGRDADQFFLAMEYVDGPSLRRTLRDGGPMSWREVIVLADRVAAALGVAHDLGLVHRDLKPGNILMTTIDGQVQPVVIDFGLAKVFEGEHHETLTRPDTMIGTPAYMSPETITGEPLDARSDIYSLGVVLFEALTGAVPYKGRSAIETITFHLQQPIPNLRERVREPVPAALVSLIEAMLAKDSSARPINSDAIRERLRHLEADDEHTIAVAAPSPLASAPPPTLDVGEESASAGTVVAELEPPIAERAPVPPTDAGTDAATGGSGTTTARIAPALPRAPRFESSRHRSPAPAVAPLVARRPGAMLVGTMVAALVVALLLVRFVLGSSTADNVATPAENQSGTTPESAVMADGAPAPGELAEAPTAAAAPNAETDDDPAATDPTSGEPAEVYPVLDPTDAAVTQTAVGAVSALSAPSEPVAVDALTATPVAGASADDRDAAAPSDSDEGVAEPVEAPVATPIARATEEARREPAERPSVPVPVTIVVDPFGGVLIDGHSVGDSPYAGSVEPGWHVATAACPDGSEDRASFEARPNGAAVRIGLDCPLLGD